MKRTPLYEKHLEAGAHMVDFGGWEMPVQYPTGIIREHLETRRNAGVFDVSHMGRFTVRGSGALPFLQHVLTGNAAALAPGPRAVHPDPRTRKAGPSTTPTSTACDARTTSSS